MLLAPELGHAFPAPAMKKTLICALVVALGAAALAIKLLVFPSVKDAYFASDNRSMRELPADLIVVRPTHYPFLKRNGIFYGDAPDDGRNDWRVMGRNVPFRSVIAAAYDCSPSRVFLPPDAPAGNFDFLDTFPTNQEKQLQKFIRGKFGYAAQTEAQDADVLLLKVTDPALPELKISSAGERPHVRWDNVKLSCKHLRLRFMINYLERFSPVPIVDETGLTNFYDYSFAWDPETIRQLRDPATVAATEAGIVKGLGLELEPETASVKMVVVKKVN